MVRGTLLIPQKDVDFTNFCYKKTCMAAINAAERCMLLVPLTCKFICEMLSAIEQLCFLQTGRLSFGKQKFYMYIFPVHELPQKIKKTSSAHMKI